MLEDLLQLREDAAYVKFVMHEQLTSDKQVYESELKDVFLPYNGWDLPKKYQIRKAQNKVFSSSKNEYIDIENIYLDAIINIDGKDYLETRMEKVDYRSLRKDIRYSAVNQYVMDRGHNVGDIDLIFGRDEEWIRKYCAKQKEAKRKYIMDKVKKICGNEIEEVSGKEINDLYVKGNNDKIAHIWAITAGGWNIQRLHIRILVKEIK